MAPAAAAGAGVVILWLLIGPASLLAALVMSAWVIQVAATGKWRPDTQSMIEPTVRFVTQGVRRARQRKALDAAYLRIVALVLAPVLVGLLSGLVSLLHHSNLQDVCDAYNGFYQEAQKPNTSTFDGEWFSRLDALGRTAEDFGGDGQDAIRAAGSAIRTVAKGRGSGTIVTASQWEADQAVGVIHQYCAIVGD